jgi:hypothetical protein
MGNWSKTALAVLQEIAEAISRQFLCFFRFLMAVML